MHEEKQLSVFATDALQMLSVAFLGRNATWRLFPTSAHPAVGVGGGGLVSARPSSEQSVDGRKA